VVKFGKVTKKNIMSLNAFHTNLKKYLKIIDEKFLL